MILTVHYLNNITGPTFLTISSSSSPCSTRYVELPSKQEAAKVFHVKSLFFFSVCVGEDEKKKMHQIKQKSVDLTKP